MYTTCAASLEFSRMALLSKYVCRIGIKIRKLKVDFMTGSTWHWVQQ